MVASNNSGLRSDLPNEEIRWGGRTIAPMFALELSRSSGRRLGLTEDWSYHFHYSLASKLLDARLGKQNWKKAMNIDLRLPVGGQARRGIRNPPSESQVKMKSNISFQGVKCVF